MSPDFRIRVIGEDIDTSSALTTADVQKLVRERLLSKAAEHRRSAEDLTAAVEEADRRKREAYFTPGTLRPDLAEENDKPWDAEEFARTPAGRYAGSREIARAERAAKFTLRLRAEKRAYHAAGGPGCGLDTVEYDLARAEHGRLSGTRIWHSGMAESLEKRARDFRSARKTTNFSGIDRRKEEQALKRKAQPCKTAFAAGGWVRWDDPETGTSRFGVVTADPNAFTGPAPKVKTRTAPRYIVPSDGGDVLAMVLLPSGSWRCQHPGWTASAEVQPALVQDELF